MQSVTIEDLKNVVALSDLPDEHLQWILEHSEYREYADGDIIAKYGEPAEIMWISLVGKVAFYMYINGRQVYYFTFENNNVTGGVGWSDALLKNENLSRLFICIRRSKTASYQQKVFCRVGAAQS